MNSTLITIAKFTQTMLWMIGFLMVAMLAAITLIILRIGKVDPEEGRVVTERVPAPGGISRAETGLGKFPAQKRPRSN